ncbi:MAG TPA: energy transducer TonB [Thermoanaerobaculia bacterium]|nr:energy transducer TonB [Thermoanaerobaculia bacterium]
MFDPLAPGEREAGQRRRRAWVLLPLSALAHLALLGGLIGYESWRAAHAPPRPIELVFFGAALTPPAEPPPTPAQWEAQRARQAMLDRLVQPTVIPDASHSPEADDAAAADAPAEAGGAVTRPEVIEQTRILPDYPLAALQAGLEGVVVVKAVIDERGEVGGIEVLRGLGFGCDEAAVAAVRQWRFKPATRHGSPVKVFYLLTVNFRL